jgi:micrococcal nuclease
MAQSHTRFPTRFLALTAGLILAACSLDAPPLWQGDLQLRGTVVAVEDGDTLTLRGQGDRPARWRIRLSDIDAPETRHGPERPGQPLAAAATEALRTMALGRQVTADCFEVDRYGRLVCHIHLPDGRLAHRALLQAGLAWPAERAAWQRDDHTAPMAQAAAQAGLGLWADPGSRPPWIWRRQCWAAPQSADACPNAQAD